MRSAPIATMSRTCRCSRSRMRAAIASRSSGTRRSPFMTAPRPSDLEPWRTKPAARAEAALQPASASPAACGRDHPELAECRRICYQGGCRSHQSNCRRSRGSAAQRPASRGIRRRPRRARRSPRGPLASSLPRTNPPGRKAHDLKFRMVPVVAAPSVIEMLPSWHISSGVITGSTSVSTSVSSCRRA